MYNIEPHKYENDTPWELPINDRIKKISEAKKMGLKTAVYLYEHADTSTFRYRVYNMCQTLELSLLWRGSYFYKDELNTVIEMMNDIDLIIICRFKWDSNIQRVINCAKEKNIKLAFDSDDLVYDVKNIPMVMNTLSVEENEDRLDYWFSYIGRIERVARQCNCMITTNDFLATKMRQDLGKDVYIAQNFLNRLQLEVSEDYYNQKGDTYEDKFVVGYFSGTPSHINDFRVVAPELKKALEECENMVFRLVGFMELPSYMHELREQGRIECYPLVNFVDLQKCIAEVDVNIVPLVYNEFTNCKSELKFFEAAVVGTPTCATPTFVFNQSIEGGEDGYLCQQGDWYQLLTNLYNYRGAGYSNIMKKARQKCIDKYAYYNQVTILDNIFESIVGGE